MIQSRRLLLADVALAAMLAFALPLRAQGLPDGDPEALGFSVERLERVGSLINESIDRREIAGAVALIARHGEVALAESYGFADIDDNEPMRADTLFRIASMTKTVTSVAVMMLYEEGRFFLNDPIAKYIPAFVDMRVLADVDGADTVPAERPITIHHLLTHTAGLSYAFLNGSRQLESLARLYPENDVSDGLRETDGVIGDLSYELGGLPLLFQPGTQWSYSIAIDVLGHLVEVVSGMTLAEFFDTRIFEPLEMHDTAFFIDAREARRLASVYVPDGHGGLRELGNEKVVEGYHTYTASYPYGGPDTYFAGGAGLTSTIGDYARFLQMLLNKGELDGVRLLSPTTVDMMTRNNIGDLESSPGMGFGYGFAVVTDPARAVDWRAPGAYHWGGFFNTRFFVDPAQELIGIFMSQQRPEDPGHISDRFIGTVYQAIVDEQ
jgi:CubicO group peptidase (beta-lactamase class C family)